MQAGHLYCEALAQYFVLTQQGLLPGFGPCGFRLINKPARTVYPNLHHFLRKCGIVYIHPPYKTSYERTALSGLGFCKRFPRHAGAVRSLITSYLCLS